MSLRQIVVKLSRRLSAVTPHELTQALFLRLLGLVYVTSFASFWPQIVGLVGSHGIAPASSLLAAVRHQDGASAFLRLPTLFWFGISDGALVTCCALGCLGGLLMLSGFFTRSAAAVCWMLYLSLAAVGQPFSNFQWDALLLESGFLALFAGASLLGWAYRFLLFRLMFESGLVKLTSHDPTWRSFQALRYHFLTQPLPNPLAYYAYRLPAGLLDGMTAATLAIELVAPFFLFGPRVLRHIAVSLLMLLQVVILLTGNYAFFNLLTLALCLWAFDDSTFAPLARWLRPRLGTVPSPRLRTMFGAALLALMAIGSFEVIGMLLPGRDGPVYRVVSLLGPFEVVNTYGLFATMTTTRPEIILEGSDDQEHWTEYSFRYKPGELRRALPWVAPYQPRLDWQMWFAALGNYQESPWVSGLMYRLLTGEPSVIGLVESPAFAKPPRYMRALLYEYQFTAPPERARTGAIWERKLLGPWLGPVSLRGQQQ